MGLEECYGKKYKLHSSEKFDDFMKALGVGLVTRKAGGAVSPTIELTEQNGTYTLKQMSTFKNMVFSFKLGEEFDQSTPDGRKIKATITRDGNKLIEVQQGPPKIATITREFSPQEVKTTLAVDDIIATRIYKLTT